MNDRTALPTFPFLCRLISFLIAGLASGIKADAQAPWRYGVLPALGLNGDIREHWRYNLTLSLENRSSSEAVIFPMPARNLDLALAVAYSAGPSWDFAGGIQYRRRDPFDTGTRLEVRPWQQASFLHRINAVRFQHRLRLEERFQERTPQAGDYDLYFRLRYRFSVDFPLQGERLDDREWYLNLSLENLLTTTRNFDLSLWDVRLYPGLGYRFNHIHRLEIAPEIRSQWNVVTANRQNMILMRLNWIFHPKWSIRRPRTTASG